MSYDLAILGDPRQRVSALAVDNTANDGIYKLVQRILILLFTDENGVASAGFGTLLPEQTIGGNLGDLEGIRGNVNVALAQVKTQIIAETPVSAPDDEQLSELSSHVYQSETERGKASVDVLITARSGDQTKVRLPIDNITVPA